MYYLNLDIDFFEHPKTVRLVGLLGKDSAVLPIRLWCYVGKFHSTNGRLAGYSPQEVEAAVGWWGSKGSMVEAMIKVRFLAEIPGEEGYEVVDWLQHQGHLKAFKERARKAALARWGISNASSNAQALVKQCPNLSNQPIKETSAAPPVWSFDAIWSKYPLKDGRKAAERHFKASVKTEQDWQDINKALANYLASERVKKGFIKNGSTWFNNWRDWIKSSVVVEEKKMDPLAMRGQEVLNRVKEWEKEQKEA